MAHIEGEGEQGSFFAFLPLTNWILGFDRYRGVYAKSRQPRVSHPGRFYMLRQGEEFAVGLAKARDLARRLQERGSEVAWIESRLPVGEAAMAPNRFTGTGVGWAWPSEEVPVSRVGLVGEDGRLRALPHEAVTAAAHAACRGSDALDWASFAPRSFSALPIAKACQAKCDFCFSKASASEAIKQRPLDLGLAAAWAEAARKAGASRAVITGGGEPTLAKPQGLLELMGILSKRVGPTLMISNGAMLGAMDEAKRRETLDAWAQAGLSTLALSRHGVGREAEARILGIDANAAQVSRDVAAHSKIKARSICVLQQGGVDSRESLEGYLRQMASEGVGEVCFKELYVSSLSENPWAASRENVFAQSRQVPLSLAVAALEALGFEEQSRLPWGSPVYAGAIDGVAMKVAAYTEPSVGWEAANKMVRSWNLMSDGACLASLEDPQSVLSLEGVR